MDAIKRQMKGTVHTHFEISQNDPFSAADRGYKVAMNLSITLRSISRSISFSWVVCCYLGKLVRLLALNSLALMFLMTNCCRQRQRRRRREKFFFSTWKPCVHQISRCLAARSQSSPGPSSIQSDQDIRR